jgi:hypothetical protein
LRLNTYKIVLPSTAASVSVDRTFYVQAHMFDNINGTYTFKTNHSKKGVQNWKTVACFPSHACIMNVNNVTDKIPIKKIA